MNTNTLASISAFASRSRVKKGAKMFGELAVDECFLHFEVGNFSGHLCIYYRMVYVVYAYILERVLMLVTVRAGHPGLWLARLHRQQALLRRALRLQRLEGPHYHKIRTRG